MISGLICEIVVAMLLAAIPLIYGVFRLIKCLVSNKPKHKPQHDVAPFLDVSPHVHSITASDVAPSAHVTRIKASQVNL